LSSGRVFFFDHDSSTAIHSHHARLTVDDSSVVPTNDSTEDILEDSNSIEDEEEWKLPECIGDEDNNNNNNNSSSSSVTFCSNPADYPFAAIRKALAKDKLLVNLLREALPSSSSAASATARKGTAAREDVHFPSFESISGRSRGHAYSGPDIAAEPEVSQDKEFASRSGLLEVNICSTRRAMEYPRKALNVNGDYLWIVNVNKKQSGEEDYTQVVTTTLCTAPDKACSAGETFSGHSTVCRQEYAEHKLLALGKDGKGLVIDTFRFPSCCTCNIIKGLEL
jgi:hypothetical protein